MLTCPSLHFCRCLCLWRGPLVVHQKCIFFLTNSLKLVGGSCGAHLKMLNVPQFPLQLGMTTWTDSGHEMSWNWSEGFPGKPLERGGFWWHLSKEGPEARARCRWFSQRWDHGKQGGESGKGEGEKEVKEALPSRFPRERQSHVGRRSETLRRACSRLPGGQVGRASCPPWLGITLGLGAPLHEPPVLACARVAFGGPSKAMPRVAGVWCPHHAWNVWRTEGGGQGVMAGAPQHPQSQRACVVPHFPLVLLRV